MSKNLFIAGTGTNIGKTYVTGLIIKKLHESGKNAAYFKAAMSGNDYDFSNQLIPGDALYVKTVSGINQPLAEMCPYVYEHAYSPHLAAHIEGNPIEMHMIKKQFQHVCERYEYVTMEGVGGIICPLRFDEKKIWQEDVIRELGLSCILVAGAGLGAINAVGTTVAYMKAKGILIKGIIFNLFDPEDVMEEDNLKMCELMTGLPILSCVKCGDKELDMDVTILKSLYK